MMLLLLFLVLVSSFAALLTVSCRVACPVLIKQRSISPSAALVETSTLPANASCCNHETFHRTR
jgi:hypothetical protein